MNFTEWYKTIDQVYLAVDKDFIEDEMRLAWDAARDEAAKIAWEHARDIRKSRLSGTRCDEIAEDIREL